VLAVVELSSVDELIWVVEASAVLEPSSAPVKEVVGLTPVIAVSGSTLQAFADSAEPSKRTNENFNPGLDQ
jgi:hypothetical protein